MANVALVVLDTLRKDAFDEFFGWLPGERFENAWSTSSWTVPAHGTLFTGLYPGDAGVYAKNETLDYDGTVLAEQLSSMGYTTRGFSANANIADAFRFTRGFDEFEHSWRGNRRDDDVLDWNDFISQTREMGPLRYPLAVKEAVTADVDTWKSLKFGVQMKARDLQLGWIVDDDDGARKALRFVEDTTFGSDEFLFLNLMEAHTPYYPPREYQTVEINDNPSLEDTMFDGPDEDPEDVRQAYRDCVRYLSDIYEEIFTELQKDFDYILTLSDHGEMFGRDGVWEHHYGVYPELTHVPLSIYSGQSETTHREETVSLLDVFPTIEAMAGGESDRPGRDILSSTETGEYVVERHGLRAAQSERIREQYDDETVAKYDESLYGAVRSDGIYGWEGRFGFDCTGTDGHDDLKNRIESVRTERDGIVTADTEADDVPDDVQDRLQELGYL